jgi:flagella basal body P-ring formation protein FlgA
LKLELMRPWVPLKVPGEDFSVTITDYPGDGLSSSFFVRCKVISDGQSISDWQIGLRAQLWQEVWVASTRLDRGQIIDSSLVTAQNVDILRSREAVISTNVDISSWEVAQGIAAGRALGKRDIVERPLIRKNQIVDVVAQHGALVINMKAQALENGSANALIKMRNLDSRKEFNAQVLDENRVRVQF